MEKRKNKIRSLPMGKQKKGDSFGGYHALLRGKKREEGVKNVIPLVLGGGRAFGRTQNLIHLLADGHGKGEMGRLIISGGKTVSGRVGGGGGHQVDRLYASSWREAGRKEGKEGEGASKRPAGFIPGRRKRRKGGDGKNLGKVNDCSGI